jgi:hypothetical protein
MTYNRALASFQASSAPPPEQDGPDTVRGLLRFCRGWLTGEVSTEDLHNPCLEMAARLRAAAEATFRDLDNNPDLCDEAREPVQDTGEGYEAIASILDDLLVLAAENRREEYQEALVDFETERVAVLDATEEINAQMSGQDRRCPRCGFSGEEERCPDCRLIQLFPDPKQIFDYSHRSAHLSSLHLQIYQAYVAVLKGDMSLEGLLKTLPPLAVHLAQLGGFCDGQDDAGESPDLVDSLRREIDTAQSGLERIRGAAVTYLASDLNRGWDDIFESALSVESLLRHYAVATGQLEEAAQVPSDDLRFGVC